MEGHRVFCCLDVDSAYPFCHWQKFFSVTTKLFVAKFYCVKKQPCHDCIKFCHCFVITEISLVMVNNYSIMFFYVVRGLGGHDTKGSM